MAGFGVAQFQLTQASNLDVGLDSVVVDRSVELGAAVGAKVLHRIQAQFELCRSDGDIDASAVADTNESILADLSRRQPLRDATGRNTDDRCKLFLSGDLIHLISNRR